MKHRAETMERERPAGEPTMGRHAGPQSAEESEEVDGLEDAADLGDQTGVIEVPLPAPVPEASPPATVPTGTSDTVQDVTRALMAATRESAPTKPTKAPKAPKPAKPLKPAKPAKELVPITAPQVEQQAEQQVEEVAPRPGLAPAAATPAREAGTRLVARLSRTPQRRGGAVAVEAPAPTPLEVALETAAAAPTRTSRIESETTARRGAAAEETERVLPAQQGKWRQRSTTRSVVFLALVAAAVATGLAGRLFVESRTDDRMRLFVAAALVVAGLWALLTATAPQIVTLKGSLLTIKSRRGVDRFDLAEGMQQVDLLGDPSSAKWSLVLHRGDCSTITLHRRDVDAKVLDPLVRHFRDIAQHRRAEHWARLGL